MSDKRDDSANIVFHYSREDRLARASEAVRDLNSPTSRKRPNLLRTLTPNRASAFLLLSIILLFLSVTLSTLLSSAENRGNFLENQLKLSAFRFEGSTYVLVTKKARGANAYRGPVNIAISSPEGDAAIQTRQLIFGEVKEESFKFSLPAEYERIVVIIAVGKKRQILKTSVD